MSEAYFISSFFSGLKDELKPMVRLLKPQTLLEASEIAQTQEQSLEAVAKKGKWPQKVMPDPGIGSIRKNWNSAKGSNVNNANPSGGYGEVKEGFKKISPQELQYRRNNNLCYKCGDKWVTNVN